MVMRWSFCLLRKFSHAFEYLALYFEVYNQCRCTLSIVLPAFFWWLIYFFFPQGIQFIVDDSGGFSGVAGEFLENIADEYANIPVLLYSVHSPDSSLGSRNNKRTVSRKLHDAVSFSRLSEFCKLIVPIGLPSLNTSKHAAVFTIFI